ncbi:hypothetical protein PAN31117_05280 [Pandoraea anapnoica]|uniref:DUF4240 domain-containing protein n=1 Tax=Pandoraea anapnoica TaxID=2508301 RepID=A0A5E5AQ23_9BURK|nr:hypothetical protein PIN31009_05453 [Pandoraea iniqua]VVE75901.1 hypothetical protein PAN31117_05280 [Pandoraea anapnoica]
MINGGCSDDGFDYFRGWLIAQGKRVFMLALAEPDSLAEVDVEMDDAYNQEMLAVGYDAYFKKMGMAQRNYATARNAGSEYELSEDERRALREEIHYASDINRTWDEVSVGAMVPKLFSKFS